jgi:hypothetical protein
VVVLKDFAYVWGACEFVGSGARHNSEMREGYWTLKVDAPAAMNPVDRFLSVELSGGNDALSPVDDAERDHDGQSGAVHNGILFTMGSDTRGGVELALGIAIALGSVLALVTAVLRRLICDDDGYG